MLSENWRHETVWRQRFDTKYDDAASMMHFPGTKKDEAASYKEAADGYVALSCEFLFW